MEAKWIAIGVIGFMIAFVAPMAWSDATGKQAQASIGVACIEAGKNWIDGDCTP